MTGRRLKVLILGGYGTFGGRLALLLARNPALTLIIAGRSIASAQAFMVTLPPGADRRCVAVDRSKALPETLALEQPDVLVDATGPFQAYGDDPYSVVRAAVSAGVNYLDLADGSAFVQGIDQFDQQARAAGVFVLSGVSSFPVLTGAAIRAIAGDLTEIETVSGGIAPSPYAGVGLNVIRAITGYAGQKISVVRGGVTTSAFALTESRRFTISPPGRVPLKNTRFSLVDVPDLVLIPRSMPSVRSLWMGAGPVPEILHRALNFFAWLVRLKLVPTIRSLAGLCYWAINTFRWGEHRGGMFVEVVGRSRNKATIRRSWHMLAEGGDGPLIPSMAVAIIVLRMLDGSPPSTGARAATQEIELTDYERMFAGRTIFSGVREDTASSASPLYRRLLGEAWTELPPPIQEMHDLQGKLVATGRASVETGGGLLARLVRRLVGFPLAGKDVPVEVSFEEGMGVETWVRSFGGITFSSKQSAGRGREERLLVERFGPVAVSLAVVVRERVLSLVVRHWSLLGLPLPLFLAPESEAREFDADDRFNFHVEISHKWTGLIVRYRGWLVPRSSYCL